MNITERVLNDYPEQEFPVVKCYKCSEALYDTDLAYEYEGNIYCGSVCLADDISEHQEVKKILEGGV